MFGVRLIPEEVQEMFEPMLGSFAPFSKGERVDDVVTTGARKDGLTRIVERFEFIFADFLRGGSLETVAKVAGASSRVRSPLEAYANYSAGVVIIGTAASRQLRQFDGKGKNQHRFFSGEPFKGGFWRCLCILAAGGLPLDETLANRLLDGMTVGPSGDPSAPNDMDSPLRLGFLNRAEGYQQNITTHLVRCLRYAGELERMLFTMQIFVQAMVGSRRWEREDRFDFRELRMFMPDREMNPIHEMAHDLARHGMAPMNLRNEVSQYGMDYRRVLEELMHRARDGRDVSEIFQRLMHENRDLGLGREFEHWLMRYLDVFRLDWERNRARLGEEEKSDTGFLGKLFGKR